MGAGERGNEVRNSSALFNAKAVRAIFQEFSLDNVDLGDSKLIELTVARSAVRAPSGAWVYIKGRSKPLSEGTVISYLRGKIGTQRFDANLIPLFGKPRRSPQSPEKRPTPTEGPFITTAQWDRLCGALEALTEALTTGWDSEVAYRRFQQTRESNDAN